MRYGLALAIGAALVLVFIVRADAQTIKIRTARYGLGSSWCNVSATLKAKCDGKTRCAGVTSSQGLGCQDPAFGKVKFLQVDYECGGIQDTAESRGHLNWRLTCPPSPQPNALAELRIHHSASCDSKEGTERLLLPTGYNYCWHHLFDNTKNGRTNSKATVINADIDGINVEWNVAPGGFPCPSSGGRGWIDHVWIVAGAIQGEACPTQP